MYNITNQNDIEKMQQYLADHDDDFAQALNISGYATVRYQKSSLWALIAIIIDQQISKAAGASIQQKLLTKIGHDATKNKNIDINTILALDIDGLRDCGLSRPKAGYVMSLCHSVRDGDFSLTALDDLADEELIAHIIQLKGFGRWSGEIYALFYCGRQNVFPAGDLALQEATRQIKRLEQRPNEKELRIIAEQWQPYRGAAAIFLWHYYEKYIRNT